MTAFIIGFIFGIFVGLFAGNKTFRTRVINEVKKLAKPEEPKPKKKGAKAK